MPSDQVHERVRRQEARDQRREDGECASHVGVLRGGRPLPPSHGGGKTLLARLEKTHGTGKALSILAHKIGRAVYYMLSRGTVFSMEKFLAA